MKIILFFFLLYGCKSSFYRVFSILKPFSFTSGLFLFVAEATGEICVHSMLKFLVRNGVAYSPSRETFYSGNGIVV